MVVFDARSSLSSAHEHCCNCKAVEEGTAYRCTSEMCGGKSASPRFYLPMAASRDGSTMAIVFFSDVARVDKPADVLVAENCTLISTVPVEIAALAASSWQMVLATSSVDTNLHTQPPPVVLEARAGKLIVDTVQTGDPDDADLQEPLEDLAGKREGVSKEAALSRGCWEIREEGCTEEQVTEISLE